MSDLHLGTRLGHDVLRCPGALERLCSPSTGSTGSCCWATSVELLEGRADPALEVAEPVLRAIGGHLGHDRVVLIVPGNHDSQLVRPWVRAHARSLRIDTPVDPGVTPELARVCAALAPARVEVRYPGVWLSDRVWATHGHYLDRHLLPESAFGLARGLLGRLPREHATPVDYELAGGPSVSRIEALLMRWLPRPLAALVENGATLARAATVPQAAGPSPPAGDRAADRADPRSAHPSREHPGARPSGPAPRRAGRLGRLRSHPPPRPAARRQPLTWSGPGGLPRLANSGCWVYEPRLVHHAAPPHPHWPGGAILIEVTAIRNRSACSTTWTQASFARAGSGGCRRTRARGSRCSSAAL